MGERRERKKETAWVNITHVINFALLLVNSLFRLNYVVGSLAHPIVLQVDEHGHSITLSDQTGYWKCITDLVYLENNILKLRPPIKLFNCQSTPIDNPAALVQVIGE